MFGSLLSDLVKIVAAPVQIAVAVVGTVAKPVAEIAQEVFKEVAEAAK